MTKKEEIKYAIKEVICVMEKYDTGVDFALVSSLKRLKKLDKQIKISNKTT